MNEHKLLEQDLQTVQYNFVEYDYSFHQMKMNQHHIDIIMEVQQLECPKQMSKCIVPEEKHLYVNLFVKQQLPFL